MDFGHILCIGGARALSNSRIEQLSAMYSKIAKVSITDAKCAILKTPTGKAVSKGNPAVLYEQPASNLLDILSELPDDTRPSYDISSIIMLGADSQPNFKSYKFSRHPELKVTMRTHLKKSYSHIMKSTRKAGVEKNRRTLYADKTKK